MGKHRFRTKIKSLVGSYIDPDKDEEVKGSNIETEDTYKKILELLKEEDQEDNKEKLFGLIEDFHQHYESIYESYDNITSKLKEKVRSKKENDSSSSSSSDSDSSLHKNGKLKKKELYMVAESLKEELQVANKEIDELKRKLAVETEEKEALNSQCQAALIKVKETENMFNELKLQSDRFHEENSQLLAELNQKVEDTNREKTDIVLEKEKAMENNEELRAILVQLEGEKEAFEEKLKVTEDELECLKLQKTEFEKQKEDEILTLKKIYEDKETESLLKIDNLQRELEIIATQKVESDNQLAKSSQEISDLLIQIERLREEKEVNKSKMKDLESTMENGIHSNEQIVEQLEETIEDLKADLEIKGDEVNTLTETVRNLEVKIRLANQKLRVTEQLLNEVEHEHAMREEKLQEQNKILMDKISTLTETMMSVKREVQEKVNETLTGFDSLTVKFEEDYGHVTTRVYEITNEVQAAQIQTKGLKQKVEEMVTKLKVSEGENDGLKKGILGKEEKIKELEKVIHVKEEGILGISEDKKEAIKQLCIWADYHRDRYDHLQELLKTTVGARRQPVR